MLNQKFCNEPRIVVAKVDLSSINEMFRPHVATLVLNFKQVSVFRCQMAPTLQSFTAGKKSEQPKVRTSHFHPKVGSKSPAN